MEFGLVALGLHRLRILAVVNVKVNNLLAISIQDFDNSG